MRIVSLLLACALVTACGPSPQAKAEQATTARRSWEATLSLVEQEQSRGAVPAKFAEQLRRAAEEERSKAAQ
jgi:hypothetical protein